MKSDPVPESIEVEVVYALPRSAFVARLRMASPALAGQAIERSGVLQRFPELEPARLEIGIFGRRCGPEAELSDGDRVEIYRALAVDAKQRRRERAAAQRRRPSRDD